jgi:hypothetical protein
LMTLCKNCHWEKTLEHKERRGPEK